MTVLFTQLATRRTAEWAAYPDAPRGYLAGEQDPDEATGIGLVTVNTVLAARRIYVLHATTLRIIASTFSTPAGTWRVDDLPSLDGYLAMAVDYAGVYEPVAVGPRYAYVP